MHITIWKIYDAETKGNITEGKTRLAFSELDSISKLEYWNNFFEGNPPIFGLDFFYVLNTAAELFLELLLLFRNPLSQ
jgi:hypothetical protein